MKYKEIETFRELVAKKRKKAKEETLVVLCVKEGCKSQKGESKYCANLSMKLLYLV